MYKVLAAATICAFAAVPACAAEQSDGNVGANFSSNGTFGLQMEFNISSMVNDKPVSVQGFIKNYSWKDAGESWGVTALGAAGIYDLTEKAKLKNPDIHPYAGAGLMLVGHKWNGVAGAPKYTGVNSGLYVTAGFRYDVTSGMEADFNYNNFGELTAGMYFIF